MNSPANVRSTEAIRDLKVAMDQFGEEVSSALSALQQEIYRIIDWLENDRPVYWRRQVQLDFNHVAEARTRLGVCKRRKIGDYRPSCIEEKKDLERAKRKLQHDQEKVELVRNWRNRFQREFEEYQGQMGQLKNSLAKDIPRSSALLVRILNALESYTEIPSGSDDGSVDLSATIDGKQSEEKSENETHLGETQR